MLFAVLALCYVSEVRAEGVGTVNISGTWAAHGTWTGDGSWNETWTITQKGKRFSGHSTGGFDFKGWVKENSVKFKIAAGCFPRYEGMATTTSMSGTMECTQGQGTGTWGATKSSGPELSGSSAAGPGE